MYLIVFSMYFFNPNYITYIFNKYFLFKVLNHLKETKLNIYFLHQFIKFNRLQKLMQMIFHEQGSCL